MNEQIFHSRVWVKSTNIWLSKVSKRCPIKASRKILHAPMVSKLFKNKEGKYKFLLIFFKLFSVYPTWSLLNEIHLKSRNWFQLHFVNPDTFSSPCQFRSQHYYRKKRQRRTNFILTQFTSALITWHLWGAYKEDVAMDINQ